MSEEIKERLEAFIELDKENLTTLNIYFTAKRRAFLRYLYDAMETGSVEERVLVKDMRPLPIDEKIKLLKWILKNIERAKRDRKRGITPSWHYTIKVEKYAKEILLESESMEKTKKLEEELTTLTAAELPLNELKEELEDIIEREIETLQKIIDAIKTETPERYEDWTPRIFEVLKDAKIKLEELYRIKIGYIRVMKMRLYYATPTKKRTPAPFVEIRAWFYTTNEDKTTNNPKIIRILEDAVDRVEEIFESLGRADAVGNLTRGQEYENQLLDPGEEEYDLDGSGETFKEEKLYYYTAFYRKEGSPILPKRNSKEKPSTPRERIYVHYSYNSKTIKELAKELGIILKEAVD